MLTISETQRKRLIDWWQKKNFGSQAISAFKTGLAAVLCV